MYYTKSEAIKQCILQKVQNTKGKDKKKLTRTVIICILNSLLFLVCSPSLAQLSSIDNMHQYASVILSIYTTYVASYLLTVREREGEREQYDCNELYFAPSYIENSSNAIKTNNLCHIQ